MASVLAARSLNDDHHIYVTINMQVTLGSRQKGLRTAGAGHPANCRTRKISAARQIGNATKHGKGRLVGAETPNMRRAR
jgi:hypothetical protein